MPRTPCHHLSGHRSIEAAGVLGGGSTAVPFRVRLPPITLALIAGWALPSPAIAVEPPDRSCGLDRSLGHTREG